jgi:hypothetical protein
MTRSAHREAVGYFEQALESMEMLGVRPRSASLQL